MSTTAHRSRGRAALAGVAVAALLAGGSAAAQPAFAASAHPSTIKAAKAHDKLGSADRDKLAKARAKGARTVTAMIVTTKGSTTSVRKAIEKVGGYVRYENSRFGYLSAAIPTGSLEKTAALDAVTAVDLDETVPLPQDRVTTTGQATGTYTGPSASTPDANPYLPTKDTGSAAFKAQHRAWDGRGVTIGILDSGIDLDSAPLRTTTTPGEEKVSDWFTATDPVTEGDFITGGDPTWLPMVQDATGPTFPAAGNYRGSVWTLPATGTYKIRTVDEAKLNLAGCELCDANRDGDKTDRIGVLYEPATHKIWVDTNDNKSFLDETAMSPYKASHQIGHIGTDNPSTSIHESIPFVVDYREHVDYTVLGLPANPYKDVTAVDIGIASGEHGSHVAGIAAGHALFGGSMNGQAPGAKLVSARACNFGTGCTAAALTDGMAKLASDGVDIINMSIGGLPALNDGDNARAALYNAIIASGVQIVISAGNSSNAFNTIGDPAVATDVVAVGADITKETWAANYGSVVDFTQGIMPFSSGGPREDGGFKPDITAPGAAIATTPMWLPGVPVAEAGYSLPVGYSMLQGTSMASPEAAGSMALLISAAKQEGVTDRSPAALRRAVFSSAQWIDGVPAHLQGRGQIDVPGAWDLLKMGLDASSISTTAPVCTEIWKLLGRSTGPGLYNRCAVADGGQAPGSTKQYKVTLTRTAGKEKSGTYALSFKGNDGTFSVSPTSVALPLNQPVDVTVTATPSAGGHTATLFVDDPKTKGLDGSMMAAVAAGEAFSAPTWSVTHTASAKRDVAKSYFVTVPAGVKALELDLTGVDDANKSQTRFLAFHPYGVNVGDTSTPVCYTNYPTTATEGNGCNPRSRAIANPQPGVWEVLVESRRTSPLLDNPYTLTAKLLGANVDPQTVTLDSVTANVPSPVSWHLVNQYAGVTAHAVGGPLGSARVQHPTINQNDDQVFTVDVPAGASRLDVTIGNPGDSSADLDLFVTGPSGAKQSADGDAEESVSYANPLPGTYQIRINGYAVPVKNMSYDYVDVFYASALGTVDVDSTPFDFPGGATHDVTGTVTAKATPAAGRSLSGQMNVLSDSGAVIGTGEVRIGSVG